MDEFERYRFVVNVRVDAFRADRPVRALGLLPIKLIEIKQFFCGKVAVNYHFPVVEVVPFGRFRRGGMDGELAAPVVHRLRARSRIGKDERLRARFDLFRFPVTADLAGAPYETIGFPLHVVGNISDLPIVELMFFFQSDGVTIVIHALRPMVFAIVSRYGRCSRRAFVYIESNTVIMRLFFDRHHLAIVTDRAVMVLRAGMLFVGELGDDPSAVDVFFVLPALSAAKTSLFVIQGNVRAVVVRDVFALAVRFVNGLIDIRVIRMVSQRFGGVRFGNSTANPTFPYDQRAFGRGGIASVPPRSDLMLFLGGRIYISAPDAAM